MKKFDNPKLWHRTYLQICFVTVLSTIQLNFSVIHEVGMKEQENSKDSAKQISSSDLRTSEGSVF